MTRPPQPDDTTDSECLGDYPSLEAFVRATLAPLLPGELRWLLDCLDLDRVLRAMTAGGRDRLRLEHGRVWLDRLR
jgi:hypothetical protein